VVAKPVSGLVDLATNTSAELRSHAVAEPMLETRLRLPRSIGPDGAIRSYSIDDARGQQMLLQLNRGDFVGSVPHRVVRWDIDCDLV
jgi:hypothetical protein